jgi:hypothetical protein
MEMRTQHDDESNQDSGAGLTLMLEDQQEDCEIFQADHGSWSPHTGIQTSTKAGARLEKLSPRKSKLFLQ